MRAFGVVYIVQSPRLGIQKCLPLSRRCQVQILILLGTIVSSPPSRCLRAISLAKADRVTTRFKKKKKNSRSRPIQISKTLGTQASKASDRPRARVRVRVRVDDPCVEIDNQTYAIRAYDKPRLIAQRSRTVPKQRHDGGDPRPACVIEGPDQTTPSSWSHSLAQCILVVGNRKDDRTQPQNFPWLPRARRTHSTQIKREPMGVCIRWIVPHERSSCHKGAGL